MSHPPHIDLPEERWGTEWAPRWTPDMLMAAVPMLGINERGLPGIERLNMLMDLAHDQSHDEFYIQPFLYPVWDAEDDKEYDGIAVACPDWLEEEGAEAQRMFFDDELSSEGWVVDWHGEGVREFPYARLNAVLGRLYQIELDAGVGRTQRVHFHVVRREDHDARLPLGILVTTSLGDDMTQDVVRAMYKQLMED